MERLPTGLRFEPTEEELILNYLHNKIMSLPLPADIPVIDVFKSDPWNLPGYTYQQVIYFFSTTDEAKYPNGDMPNCSGHWKDTGINKEIVVCKGTDVIVGMRKTLVFYKGYSPNSSMTGWVNYQYSIPASAAADGLDGTVISPMKKIKLSEGSADAAVSMDNYWVLNKVYRKTIDARMRMIFLSFWNAAPAPAPASSDSSVITVEKSLTHEPDHQEGGSSRKP
ncbi:NAC domain-containing protein 83-like [Impatiens glandulifera]|uniref:NAC domain-containing protein 83-like n=1 Tax=Impatiens glandulifera TaxID=253017 RepID=UPI001FB14FFE|nr:NAC domain-containing protein 83-like [Impatiens glandulifera]